jgi:soluble lytic murein transglycosylase
MKTAACLGRSTRGRLSKAVALLLLCAAAAPSVQTPDQKQWAVALKTLKPGDARLAALRDYEAYYAVSASFEREDWAAVVREAPAAWQGRIASPVTGKAAILAAKALLKLDRSREAVQTLRNRAADLPQPEGGLILANALEASGDEVSAAVSYQHVYYDYPVSKESGEARLALERLRTALGDKYPPPMPQAMFARASKLQAGREYARARNEYEAIAEAAGGAERDLARVRIGVCDYQARENNAAYRYLRSLEVSAPEADAERLYFVFASARRVDDDDGIAQALEELARKHPRSSWRLEALIGAANIHLLVNRPERYLPLYSACHDAFAGQPAASVCHWRVTWQAYLQRKSEAGSLLREHLSVYPGSEHANAALYFLGRLDEDRGDLAAAKSYYAKVASKFPNSYYAVLARQRIAGSRLASVSAVEPAFLSTVAVPEHKRQESFQAGDAAKTRIERARLLVSIGLDELAETELRFGARSGEQPHVIAIELAKIATRKSAPEKGIRYIKAYAPGLYWFDVAGTPDEFWRLAYPLPFRISLETWAREYNLDPFLLAGLIRQESEFDAKVISHAKAYGLTQVLPSTGRSLARRAGLKRFTSNMLFQPDVNLHLGAIYLRDLLNAHGGNVERALASYNAGKSRTDEWQTWADFREQPEFVETIPFSETRNYIQSVLRNADFYRRLYAGTKAEAASTVKAAPKKSTAPPAAKRKPKSKAKVRK